MSENVESFQKWWDSLAEHYIHEPLDKITIDAIQHNVDLFFNTMGLGITGKVVFNHNRESVSIDISFPSDEIRTFFTLKYL